MDTHQEISTQEYRALAEFRYQLRRFLRFSEESSRAVGLVPQQHQLLLALKGLPEDHTPTVGELAERLQIHHHSTVELIDRMVERDLLERTRDEADQRRVIIRLTPHGKDVLRDLSLLHQAELRTNGPGLVKALLTVLEDQGRDGGRRK